MPTTTRRRCPQTGQELPTDDEISNTDWVIAPTPDSVRRTGDRRPTPISRDAVRRHVARRASGSWVDLTDGDNKPRNLPRDSPVEGIYRARKQASPRAWNGYDEFANTVEFVILVMTTLSGAAFFGLGFFYFGVENVFFKAFFAFWCFMVPLRLVADGAVKFTATRELRILGPINSQS